MPIEKPAIDELEKMGRRKTFRGYPIGTVSYYGPTDKFASKVAVGIMGENKKIVALERWFSEVEDIRRSEEITQKVVKFLKFNNVESVVIPDRIIGCPHEEGIDYPEGSSCPKCPFWANHDRWTGEIIEK